MTKNKSQSPSPSTHKVEVKLSFPVAMQNIMNGSKVRRTEWTDKEEYCLLKDNFLMIHRNNKFHTWIVSEGDMLAIDWVTIK
ncbi:MAG: DUF2829 domain-containing protein [Candidatus Levybacteria bacterium]|nr:DUF2829 domain-containing protein [Candidatus Levybacteria bacterium]